MDYKKYTNLEKPTEYNKELAGEIAEAFNELEAIQKRAFYLLELTKKHKGLTKRIWRTAEGKHIAFHDLKNDHLKNILNHLLDTNRSISKELKEEARFRGIDIPTTASINNFTLPEREYDYDLV